MSTTFPRPPLAKTPATPTSPELPSTPTATLKDVDLVSPADAAATGVVSEPAAVPASQEPKSLMKLIEEQFVQVVDLAGTTSSYPWRGVCKKCGWHTHQFTQDDAFRMTRSHAQIHWRDVTRFL
jgi:hypothetical protein